MNHRGIESTEDLVFWPDRRRRQSLFDSVHGEIERVGNYEKLQIFSGGRKR